MNLHFTNEPFFFFNAEELKHSSIIVITVLRVHDITFARTVNHRDGRIIPKMGQIGSKWDKSGTFSDQISVHWLAEPMY